MSASIYPEHANKIKSLPVLPVVRGDFCSQDMANQLVTYLEKNASGKLFDCMIDETPVLDVRWKAYSKLADYIRNEASKNVQIPDSDIGIVDFLYEVSRRIRNAYNLPEVKVLGKSMVLNDAENFPSLLTIEIDDQTKKLDISQQFVDGILETLYANDIDLWWVVGEARRRSLMPYFLNAQMHLKIKDLVKKSSLYKERNLSESDISQIVSQCRSEMYKRVRVMCFLPVNAY